MKSTIIGTGSGKVDAKTRQFVWDVADALARLNDDPPGLSWLAAAMEMTKRWLPEGATGADFVTIIKDEPSPKARRKQLHIVPPPEPDIPF